MCPGCYKPEVEGYCLNCRKKLFDGRKVNPVLNFDPPTPETIQQYQEKTIRLSISGVQLKYSLCLHDNELILTEKGGQYIIKPIPPTTLIQVVNQAPENEHLTMQMASQLFGIKTAANALIYFKDGTPAYITRRFDVKQDGSKYLQEDMAQLTGRTKQSAGENFKYDGTYAEIGQQIRQHVAAYPLVIEQFFRAVLFNYIFSNGDAHLKNFSLIETDMGDFTLSPAYDIMCTVVHTTGESDTAIPLYQGDMNSLFYEVYGYYGQVNFRELAHQLGLLPKRAEGIISQMLSNREKVLSMIQTSLLSDKTKAQYIRNYQDKLHRMGMTASLLDK